MGNKAPAKASELNKITTLHAIKDYFKTHTIDKDSEYYEHQVDEIIVTCLKSPMPLMVFQYLLKKIGYWSIVSEYEYLKSHIDYTDKALNILDYFMYKTVDFVEYTNDERLLEYLMRRNINKGVNENVIIAIIVKYNRIGRPLAKFHPIVISKARAHIIELFEIYDKTFKLEEHYDKNRLRIYHKELNEWHDINDG